MIKVARDSIKIGTYHYASTNIAGYKAFSFFCSN